VGMDEDAPTDVNPLFDFTTTYPYTIPTTPSSTQYAMLKAVLSRIHTRHFITAPKFASAPPDSPSRPPLQVSKIPSPPRTNKIKTYLPLSASSAPIPKENVPALIMARRLPYSSDR
jgi:hypothetical protein